MISIFFHKRLTSSLSKRIESFCQTFPSIGLHQDLLFSQAMEPKRQIVYCIAENTEKVIQGFSIIHYSFPIASIQDGPIAKNAYIVNAMIDSIRNRFSIRFFAFTTIQLPYASIAEPKYNSKIDLFKNYINYPNWSTSIIDLTKNENDLKTLIKNFSKGHVSAIKKAEKTGISVSNEFADEKIKAFALLFDETYKTRNIKTQWDNSLNYFTMLSEIMKPTKSFFIGAYHENCLVAGGIFLTQGDTVHYKFGSSNHQIRSIPLMHSVLYNAMLYAQNQGFHYFDLGGINTNAPEGSQVWAINTFKKGFGGNIISSPERIYLSNNRITLAFVLLLLKFKRLIHK